MSDSTELKPNTPAGTPVPDLIEQYRVRRDAWIAQADELARLRDEVRGSAEREAMEIVTAARRDVRQIVMEARRELLVLSAQVQAALGEAGARPDPSALLNRARDTDDDAGQAEISDAFIAPEDAVKGMLEEARAGMDALVEDARTVPFQALAEPAPTLPPPEPPTQFSHEPLFTTPQSPPPPPVASSQAPPITPSTSRVLLSSPFPSDSVPVPASRRAKIVVGLFGAAGIAVLVGTIWWLRSDKGTAASTETARSTTPASSTPASGAVSPTATSTPTPAPAPAAAFNTASPSALSLVVEARRSSWLRTSVDGQSDTGRMLAEGETVRLNAKESISLRVGDAGAVFVSVNKGKAAPLGRDGEVVSRQFVVESTDRGAAPAPSQPTAPPLQQPLPGQRPAPLSSAIATGPSSGPPPNPNPVPLVQPLAAAGSNPPPDPGPPPTPRAEAPASRGESTVPPPAAPRQELPTPGAATPVSAVVAASRQWLDAYHRQDRAAIASLSTEGLQLADERRNEERFPANMDVSRTLDRISVQIAADTAVLTAVMTERSSDNGVPPRVSPISQVWELRGNQWRVRQVRLVSEARLNQIFR